MYLRIIIKRIQAFAASVGISDDKYRICIMLFKISNLYSFRFNIKIKTSVTKIKEKNIFDLYFFIFFLLVMTFFEMTI